MKNKHIGSNFDDFLKEENIEIDENDIKNKLFSIKIGNYVRQFTEDIDKTILRQMSRDGLLKVISECQIELQRRYENNEDY